MLTNRRVLPLGALVVLLTLALAVIMTSPAFAMDGAPLGEWIVSWGQL